MVAPPPSLPADSPAGVRLTSSARRVARTCLTLVTTLRSFSPSRRTVLATTRHCESPGTVTFRSTTLPLAFDLPLAALTHLVPTLRCSTTGRFTLVGSLVRNVAVVPWSGALGDTVRRGFGGFAAASVLGVTARNARTVTS